MVDFFNFLYSLSFNEYKLLDKLRINSLIRYIVRIWANMILPLWLSGRHEYGLCDLKKDKQVIVSLTSFPNRIPKVWMVIETIFSQTIKPDKIILYLSELQFPNKEFDLPSELLEMQKRGLSIEFVSDDIRSHKKYYYAMNQYPNDFIITIDDDIFYPSTMIQTLLDYHKQYPNSIICRYAKKIVWKEDATLYSSAMWPRIYSTCINEDYIFLGTGGGTLFPNIASRLYKDTLNIRLARDLCPLEDDLWLNTMIRLQDTKIVAVKDYKGILPVLNKKDIMLYSENGGDCNMTDKQMENVLQYYQKYKLNPYKSKYV